MKRISLLLLLLLSSCNGYVDKPHLSDLKAKLIRQDMTNIRNEVYDYYGYRQVKVSSDVYDRYYYFVSFNYDLHSSNDAIYHYEHYVYLAITKGSGASLYYWEV